MLRCQQRVLEYTMLLGYLVFSPNGDRFFQQNNLLPVRSRMGDLDMATYRNAPQPIKLSSIAYLLFIHDGQIYQVATAPTDIFKSAIQERCTQFGHEATNKLLKQEELDKVSRWFLLNELISLKKPMQLYQSMGHAERAVKLLV
jgi:hypothetical protein